MTIYAIGDVQGCFQQLQQLLDKLGFDSNNDNLWFAGDIINRGPDSLATLRFIKSLGDSAITVLGNHDLHLLAVANGRRKQGKKDTIKDILSAPDREELLDWLLHRPLIHYDHKLDICLVHAGIYPHWSIEQSLNYASEVENILRGKKHHEYFHHMYGDKPPKWSEHLKGWDRLRFITNVFTRMRYCMDDGHLDLKDKSSPGSQQSDVIPWFDHPERKTENTSIIFGHWSTLTDPGKERLYPLDTGCLWGGKLTALKIDQQNTRQRISIECPQVKPIDYDHGFKHKKI
ncbi:MAG: symmetrical bis(5'-nucleosyl)-tetraphosphatase [Gammaproteobacteria bacterium]|nr:symmetrical bis(5'-nucleosyl)-tetraphosphatase [Gammaproteobacteria bacterium]